MPLIMIVSVYLYGRNPRDLKFGVFTPENVKFNARDCQQTKVFIKDLSSEDLVSKLNLEWNLGINV